MSSSRRLSCTTVSSLPRFSFSFCAQITNHEKSGQQFACDRDIAFVVSNTKYVFCLGGGGAELDFIFSSHEGMQKRTLAVCIYFPFDKQSSSAHLHPRTPCAPKFLHGEAQAGGPGRMAKTTPLDSHQRKVCVMYSKRFLIRNPVRTSILERRK